MRNNTSFYNFLRISFIVAMAFQFQFAFAQKEKVNKEYYENGQLKSIGVGNPITEKSFSLGASAAAIKSGKKEKLQDGEWKYFHENGKLEAIGKYYMGQKIGQWKNYYENGQLKEQENWKRYMTSHRLDGLWKEYYKNGNLKTEGSYISDVIIESQKQGEWKEYFEYGALSKVIIYDHNRELSVSSYNKETANLDFVRTKSNDDYNWKLYHDNGELKESGITNRHGNKFGVWKTYDESGNLGMAGNYDNDKKNGEWKSFYNTGKVAQITNYSNDVGHGKYIAYWENGSVYTKGNIEKANKIGEWIVFNEDGTVQSNTNFTTGTYTDYYKNEQVRQTGSIKDNKRDGLWKTYFENGQLLSIGNFSSDVQTGEWKFYHDNGQLFNIDDMVNGKLMNRSSLLDRNGNPLDVGTFKDGNGLLNWYDPDGKLQKQSKMLDGKEQEQN